MAARTASQITNQPSRKRAQARRRDPSRADRSFDRGGARPHRGLRKRRGAASGNVGFANRRGISSDHRRPAPRVTSTTQGRGRSRPPPQDHVAGAHLAERRRVEERRFAVVVAPRRPPSPPPSRVHRQPQRHRHRRHRPPRRRPQRADMHPQFWWFLTRSSGLVAWVLLTIAVAIGLLLSTRLLGRSAPPSWLLWTHRVAGALVVAMTALHLVVLVADSYVRFDLADIAIPFAANWRPGAIAWGVIAMWIMIVVEVTSLLMRRIPRRVWHAIHMTSLVAFAAATAHGVQSGTDTSQPIARGSRTSGS